MWMAGRGGRETQVWTSNLSNLRGAPSSLTSGPSFLTSRAQVDDSLPLQSLQLPLATPRVLSPSPGGKPSQPAENTCLLLSFPPFSAHAPDVLPPDLFFPKCRLERRDSRQLDQTQKQVLWSCLRTLEPLSLDQRQPSSSLDIYGVSECKTRGCLPPSGEISFPFHLLWQYGRPTSPCSSPPCPYHFMVTLAWPAKSCSVSIEPLASLPLVSLLTDSVNFVFVFFRTGFHFLPGFLSFSGLRSIRVCVYLDFYSESFQIKK